MENNLHIQENEILALQSILDTDLRLNTNACSSNEVTYSGCISIQVDFKTDPVNIIFGKENLLVTNLPPVILRFYLGLEYPSCLPQFELACFWLDSLALQDTKVKLIDIWECQKAEILFEWVDFIKNFIIDYITINLNKVNVTSTIQGYDESYFSLNTFLLGPLHTIDIKYALKHNPIILFREWDTYITRKEFNLTSQCCNICFDTKRGNLIISLKKCSHIFCRQCLSDYYKLLIKEGSVFKVNCPHNICQSQYKRTLSYIEKSKPELDDILELVGIESFRRYQYLVLKKRLEVDPMTLECPQVSCGKLIIKSNQDDLLCICKSCGYAFCQICKQTWHNSQNPCNLSQREVILKFYQKAKALGNTTITSKIDSYYGKPFDIFIKEPPKKISLKSNLIATPCPSLKFKLIATPCPGCLSNTQKIDGCNRMVCPVCDTDFCFFCGKFLSGTSNINAKATFCNCRC